MNPDVWVPIGAPVTEQDAHFLRDLIHQAGYPARIERITDPLEIKDGRNWRVFARDEHADAAFDIRDRNFTGPSRRPTRRWSLTGILRGRRPAA